MREPVIVISSSAVSCAEAEFWSSKVPVQATATAAANGERRGERVANFMAPPKER
jgi:hypothetical protein